MTKENQHNSNLPDPDKPWCIKCSRHTRYESKYHRNENNTGHYTYKCRKCDGVIYTINDAKYYIGIIKIVLWMSISIIPLIPLGFYFTGSPDVGTITSLMNHTLVAIIITALITVPCFCYSQKLKNIIQEWEVWATKLNYIKNTVKSNNDNNILVLIGILLVTITVLFVFVLA